MNYCIKCNAQYVTPVALCNALMLTDIMQDGEFVPRRIPCGSTAWRITPDEPVALSPVEPEGSEPITDTAQVTGTTSPETPVAKLSASKK